MGSQKPVPNARDGRRAAPRTREGGARISGGSRLQGGELTALRTGERREAYLADLSKRLSPAAVDSARWRLDQAIDHALKLGAEYKVVKNGDFEKQSVQKSILEPEINAENPVEESEAAVGAFGRD